MLINPFLAGFNCRNISLLAEDPYVIFEAHENIEIWQKRRSIHWSVVSRKNTDQKATNVSKRDISCVACKRLSFAEILISNDTTVYPPPLPPRTIIPSQPIPILEGSITSPYIRYSKLQATVMLPRTDDANERLVDMN
jgi:hypothetical protein